MRAEVRGVRRVGAFSPPEPPRPRALSWVRPAASTEEALEDVSREAPLGPDVVEWMQEAAAANAVLDAYAQRCEEGGGELRWRSGDPYIPGVRVDREFYAVSEPWWRVRDRGYGRVRTPYGEDRVPVGGKALFARGSFLGWGVLPRGWWIQWLLTLVRYVRLPRLPLRRRVHVALVHGRAMPFFAEWAPKAPLPLGTLRLVVGSERAQTIVLRGRSHGAYEDVIWEQSVDVEEGECEVVLGLMQLPFISRQAIELQCEDGVRSYVGLMEAAP